MSAENQKSSGEQLLLRLQRGTPFIKVKEEQRKTHERTFCVNKEATMLSYRPSKKGWKARYMVEDIKEVRVGHETDTFKARHTFPKETCFSVIIGVNNKSLNLVARSAEEAKAWVEGLKYAMAHSKAIDIHKQQQIWIRDYFLKADTNKDGTLDFDECFKLLNKMNMKIDRSHAKKLFKEADARKSETASGKIVENRLDIDEFVEFYRKITDRTELKEVFNKYSGDDDYWTAAEFMKFMHESQKRVDVKEEWCLSVIDKYEQKELCKQKRILSYDGFVLFMLGPNGLLFNPFHNTIYQDMTQPLTHYFIASSHNTYLMHDQLRGPSSTEAYIKCLQKGCRCVELDVWDGPDNDPVVYHGHTLTSKILFRDIIEVVNKYAFVASEYPVILSLENHCSVPQQQVMADIMQQILGDKIYKEPVKTEDTIPPSPTDLKGKILIKGKKLKVEDEGDGDVSDEDEAADIENIEDEEVRKQMESSKKKKFLSIFSGRNVSSAAIQHESKKLKLAKDLSLLVTLCKSVHFHNFKESAQKYKFYEMSSFGESKAVELAKSHGEQYNEHNKKFLSRTYPAGWRTNSSNYNPCSLWNAGCAIVALNYQTHGEEMDLYLGKFKQNGNCGYILKPVFMRKEGVTFDPEKPGDQYKSKLKIKIISGQQLPKPKGSKEIIDPFVKVTLHGVFQEQEDKTEVVENNGFNPHWNHEMEFDVKVPELSLLRFTVYDYDMSTKNDFIGQYTIPVTSMQLGYTHMPLYTDTEELLYSSTLFVHVSLE
ncbi:1-phosphatidylinositol 4,5-bisphosphate phosphodiesterase delta-1-like isoform X2 [Anneissia japonica]|uniref:1-phosphatidylinositol 4,5-bisphosphate phosphodiesterase delta-1-like isoform X2 n=1 Tax=Anneissia japonica TaxID=1529436 RepID=UPI0014254E15|nr:1-phosphatidylinositol 4,5-bisphosphate phosphodiesterase delta-1-like isoform X2 [Anneissia japonica]